MDSAQPVRIHLIWHPSTMMGRESVAVWLLVNPIRDRPKTIFHVAKAINLTVILLCLKARVIRGKARVICHEARSTFGKANTLFELAHEIFDKSRSTFGKSRVIFEKASSPHDKSHVIFDKSHALYGKFGGFWGFEASIYLKKSEYLDQYWLFIQ